MPRHWVRINVICESPRMTMTKRLHRWVEAIWYEGHWAGYLLWPLSQLFWLVVALRRWCYQQGYLRTQTLAVPVVIVGNLTVGGTGKTPLIIYLTEVLRQAGFKPGIISRGYGGKAATWPQLVHADSDPALVGDETVLLARRTACPLAVGPLRAETGRFLLQQHDCDILLSDDGLQHYALARTLEIVVIDGERRFGNGWCLPAGPLREPLSRLPSVDMCLVNGGIKQSGEYAMQVQPMAAVNLLTGELRALHAFQQSPCHALAGIGNPQRFFAVLSAAALQFTAQVFPDHYAFSAADVLFADDLPVLMTEKDAVKCSTFAHAQLWYIPIKVQVETGFAEHFLNLLHEKLNGH